MKNKTTSKPPTTTKKPPTTATKKPPTTKPTTATKKPPTTATKKIPTTAPKKPPTTTKKIPTTKPPTKTTKKTEENLAIEYMNSKYAVSKLGGKVVVIQEAENPATGQQEVEFISPADLKIFYQNRPIFLGRQSSSWGDFWLKHSARRTYENVIFHPDQDYKTEKFYNLYKGLSIKPKQGNCQKFWAHIQDNICQGDEKLFNYLQCWMADCIQNPLDRKGIALVLKGGQGTGKGIVANNFGKIFGRHFKHITNQKHLIGNFNSHLKDALFVFVDEAFWAGDKQGQGVLKSLITEDQMMIEQKGKDAYMLKNYTRIMMASNENWVAPVEIDDRRYCIIEVGEHQKRNYPYFKSIHEEMQSGGLEALLYDLKHLKINVDIRNFPESEAIREQKINSFTPLQAWWFHVLEQETYEIKYTNSDGEQETYQTHLTEHWECTTTAFFDDYKKFIKEMNVRNRMSPTQFGLQIKNLIPGERRRRRTREEQKRRWVYLYLPVEQYRSFFELNANQDLFENDENTESERF